MTYAAKNEQAILAAIRNMPDKQATAARIARRVGLSTMGCRAILLRLSKRGRVTSSGGNPSTYTLGGITRPDHRGARTQQERDLVDVIETLPQSRCEAIAAAVGRHPTSINAQLQGLVRRQVLTLKNGKYSLAENAGELDNGNAQVVVDDGAAEGIEEDLSAAGVL